MKRIFSLLLAAILLASAVTACGNATDNKEPSAPETAISETAVPETQASDTETPAYSHNIITENGTALAHIVLPVGASQPEQYASEELVYHIKKVSGADITVTDTVQEGSLPIIIATPDSLPELETLFPEDLAWLRDLGNPEDNVRFGDDGFSIRTHEGKIYIFGSTPRGALNGVYDFIEDNMGVLWIRSNEDVGLIFDEMPTITVEKTNYKEKSPFDVRGWTLNGSDLPFHVMLSRNKLNSTALHPSATDLADYNAIGMNPFISTHNIKWWIQTSPSYDPDNHEYWSTNMDGVHAASADTSAQINFWSDVTMQCIADNVLSYLDQNKEAHNIKYVGISLQDIENPSVYPEMKEPYEYADGKTVAPTAVNYYSTVYFSFLNKIARIVGEKYPDVKLHAYAYACVIPAPACELEDNLYVTFCPLDEDLGARLGESGSPMANQQYENLLNWMELTTNIQVYNYYGCCTASSLYERPIWDVIQSHAQLYAENGLNGFIPEGIGDVDLPWCTDPGYGINNEVREPYMTMQNCWEMNNLCFWLYSKLTWNPYEDVDALIEYYCTKVYGDIADEMLEYYRILQLGWDYGCADMAEGYGDTVVWNLRPEVYWEYFLCINVDGVNIAETLTDILRRAYDSADEEGKERLKYRVEIFDKIEELFVDW